MADTCEPSTLMAAAKCFTCLGPTEQYAIQTYLLCQISGMSCEPATLMDSARCFTCLEESQLAAINTYLLCQILLAGGGGGGVSVSCGIVNPVAAPTGSCAIYYRTDNGAVWVWNGAGWLPIIAA